MSVGSRYPIPMQRSGKPGHLSNESPNESSLWFPAILPRPHAALRLICFPYAGAGVAAFRAWPESLGDATEVRVAQLPGRGARLREERYERMSPLIDSITENIRPLLDRPFALFGHSMGALVAFEVARRLCDAGHVPAHLFVSGHIAPHLPNPFPQIHQLPRDAFLRELLTLNGMPKAVLESKELLEIVLPAIRSDFTLLETYEYEPRPLLKCPITAFGGFQDPRTNTSGLQSWGSETSGEFYISMMAGDHFFLDTMRPALLDALARRLNENSTGVTRQASSHDTR